MKQTIEDKNKALVLKAFDTLFKRDYAVAEGQHASKASLVSLQSIPPAATTSYATHLMW
jgi:hypothetical protein